MEPRGQSWYEHSSQHHRPGRRDDPYQSHHPEQQAHYLPSDARERDRQWYAADPRYLHYMSNPPPVPEFTYSNQGYTPTRVSRLAYDYPPHTYWDYRDNFSYYDYDHYRVHHGYPAGSDGSGRPGQASWRTEEYQEWTEAPYAHEYGYDLSRDTEQIDGGVSARERRKSTENGIGTLEACEPGGLASFQSSGLSSSTYELSQYINGAEQNDVAPPAYLEPEVESKSVAPLKFCVPHVAVSFGAAGQLVRVTPALPSHGEPAQVELHSMEIILSDTQRQSEMRDYPGPLMREDLHKVDAINFALQMAEACLKNETVVDPSSASLMWHLLVLLCRQNGRIVGSDVAELLVNGSRSIGACSGEGEQSDVGSLIDLCESLTPETVSLGAADLLTGNPLTNEETSEQNIQNYSKLLLAGRKKEALELAMRSGLWGHALFLASKMDSRAYSTVLSRFTGSLFLSDPLQTLFQYLSGRIPVVATSYSREKWGDWRPHLAVLLSNETGDSLLHCKSIVTLGDTLASRGLLHAAHICYLTAHMPFSWYTNKSQRLVLLGSSHSDSFAEFCSNSAIRCTEMFEYCQRLGDQSFIIPSFQVYKFLYACRLLDCGLISQAFHYCELVAKAMLTVQEPHMVLLEEIVKLVDRLKHSELQLGETGTDPDWLVLLRQRLGGVQIGNLEGSISAQSESWKQLDNGSASKIIYSTLPDESQNGAAEERYDQSEYAAQQRSSYPSEEQSNSSYQTEQPYPSHPLEQQSYPTETQSLVVEEPLPQIYAPVPMYSQQNVHFSGNPPISKVQNAVHYPDSSYHQSALGMDMRSHSEADTGFSSAKEMVDTSENGTALESTDLDTKYSEAHLKETTGQELEKESKPGWFSGWFRSKRKETPQTQNRPESPPIPTFSTPPMVSPSLPPSQHQASGINPFSRRAGQKPSSTLGHNHGSMSQGP